MKNNLSNRFLLVMKVQNVEVSDTTGDAIKTKVGFKKCSSLNIFTFTY